jgi:hypothetical protein
MTSSRYPTLEEFWKRLSDREVETDLVHQLRERTLREQSPVLRLGSESLVLAVVERLLPSDVPARALAVFIDQNFDKQLGRADEPAGKMPREQMIPAGFRVVDESSSKRYGKSFSEIANAEKDTLLVDAEKGNLAGPEGFDSQIWFKRVRDLLLLAFGSDPRGMVQMGFPGPSYKPGHIWLDSREVKKRSSRKKGYLKF